MSAQWSKAPLGSTSFYTFKLSRSSGMSGTEGTQEFEEEGHQVPFVNAKSTPPNTMTRIILFFFFNECIYEA